MKSWSCMKLARGLSGLVVAAGLAGAACSKENTVDASTQCGDGNLDCAPCNPGAFRCDGIPPGKPWRVV